jgi:hypothetical protein
MHLLINVPWLKRMYETGRCHIARASSFVAKVQEEVFTHFTQSLSNVTVVSGVDCFACQDEFFVNNLRDRDTRRNDVHAHDPSLYLSFLFSQGGIGVSPLHARVRLKRSSPSACLSSARLSIAFSLRFEQNSMHTRRYFALSIRPHTTENVRT